MPDHLTIDHTMKWEKSAFNLYLFSSTGPPCNSSGGLSVKSSSGMGSKLNKDETVEAVDRLLGVL